MNLHETLTNGRSLAHVVPIRFLMRHEEARRPALPAVNTMAHRRRHYPLLLSLAVLGVLLLVPAGASAATCDWRDMIDAAANGRQISTHSTACYQRALSEVPADTDGYLPQVRANLVYAMRRDEGLAVVRNGGDLSRELQSNTPAVAASVRGPVTDLLEGLGPKHVDQVPLPVLALGSLASLLLLAGLGTSLRRVRAARRMPRHAPTSP
jgi:hypothetical protein